MVALLEPLEKVRELEAGARTLARLSLLEEVKTLPFGPVWDHCLRSGVPPSDEWLREVEAYERRVLSRR